MDGLLTLPGLPTPPQRGIFGHLCHDRSMRCDRRGFPLDLGLLGHGRCGGRGLIPLDLWNKIFSARVLI